MRITKLVAATAGAAATAYATYVATTWLRYGHPRRRRGHEDALLDRFMRDHDVVERHAIAVDAPAEVTFAASKEMELDESRIVRAIFRARELILRAAPDATSRPKAFFDLVTSLGWGVLAETPGREVVLGAVTKPWKANPVFRALSPDEFEAFDEPDHVKIAWTLRADPAPNGGSIFRTETRAVATDASARSKFRMYWSLLSPGIILIREAMLPALKARAERAWRIEGDDLVPDASAQLTHTTMIDAGVEDVWPWLLQMGCQRAGWYSWDILDNGGKRSADRIIPELQHLDVGDILPARPRGTEGFEVLRVVPERAIVLRSMATDWLGTWAFMLEPVGDQTRLVARYRAAIPPRSKLALALPLISAIHGFMERKQLRTIKHHAEHMREN